MVSARRAAEMKDDKVEYEPVRDKGSNNKPRTHREEEEGEVRLEQQA